MDSLSSNGQTIGSDALRKAIERNRKKNENHQGTEKEENRWSPPPRSNDNKAINSLVTKGLVKNLKVEQLENDNDNDSDGQDQEEKTYRPPWPRAKSTRESVATQDEEVSFISSLKDKRNKMTEILSYSSARENRAKKNVSKGLSSFFVKLAWVLAGVLILRLIIMDRGVWDYYSREKELSLKIEDYKTLLAENIAIRKEIFKIKNNVQLQKKLVRDHLGFISADEFLVLFPEEDEGPAK